MNDSKNNSISLIKAILIYLTALYSPCMRTIVKNTARVANQAAWLSFPCSMIIFIPVFYMLYRVVRTFEGQSLHNIMCSVLGKVVGKILTVLLIVWTFILLSAYINYAGGKVIASIYVGTDFKLVFFIFSALTAIMLRAGLPTLSRMTTIIYVLAVAQFVIIAVLLFINFDVKNITPISSMDVAPIFSSIVYPLNVSLYITFLFAFNDQITYKKSNKAALTFGVGYLNFANIMLVLATLGMFGFQLIEKLNLPMLTAVENIKIHGGEGGMESLFVAFWIIIEFVLISFFAYIVVRLIRDLFGLKRQVPVLTAVMGLAFFFSIYFCSDLFEITKFSNSVAPYFTLSLGIGIPVLLFITAKARKMLPAPKKKPGKSEQAVPQA